MRKVPLKINVQFMKDCFFKIILFYLINTIRIPKIPNQCPNTKVNGY